MAYKVGAKKSRVTASRHGVDEDSVGTALQRAGGNVHVVHLDKPTVCSSGDAARVEVCRSAGMGPGQPLTVACGLAPGEAEGGGDA